MPEGYKCDLCGEFDKHTHGATEIDFGEVLRETGTPMGPTSIICPNCAQELWVRFLGNPAPEQRAIENHSKIEVTGE